MNIANEPRSEGKHTDAFMLAQSQSICRSVTLSIYSPELEFSLAPVLVCSCPLTIDTIFKGGWNSSQRIAHRTINIYKFSYTL